MERSLEKTAWAVSFAQNVSKPWLLFINCGNL